MNRQILVSALRSLADDVEEDLDLDDAFGEIQKMYWTLQDVYNMQFEKEKTIAG